MLARIKPSKNRCTNCGKKDMTVLDAQDARLCIWCGFLFQDLLIRLLTGSSEADLHKAVDEEMPRAMGNTMKPLIPVAVATYKSRH